MSEHMGVVVEVWPLAADETGMWLLSDDAWRSGRVPADDEPHSELVSVLRDHGAKDATVYMHSTSWRVDGPHVVLTYIAIVDVGEHSVREVWRDAKPIGPALAAAVGPAAPGPATDPPAPSYADVIFHGIRHLRFLLDNDAVAAASLGEHWRRHLAWLEPELDIMYMDRRWPEAG